MSVHLHFYSCDNGWAYHAMTTCDYFQIPSKDLYVTVLFNSFTHTISNHLILLKERDHQFYKLNI